MIYILHIETATKVCSVALSGNGQFVDSISVEEDGFAHGEKLTLLIEEILAKNNITPKELDAVSVSSGPGSYTGLRIGVSTAKGLCYALSIPLIAIVSLTSLYFQAKEKHPNQRILAMIDARRMEVFSAIFNPRGDKTKEISADILDELSYETFLPCVAIGDAVAKMQTVWENRSVIWETELKSNAIGQIQPAFEAFEAKKWEDVAYFEPFYLKDFVAGVKKESSAQ
jgi:tRNA threonylcarbamoyladenosine biosynthesis protein TsaB